MNTQNTILFLICCLKELLRVIFFFNCFYMLNIFTVGDLCIQGLGPHVCERRYPSNYSISVSRSRVNKRTTTYAPMLTVRNKIS